MTEVSGYSDEYDEDEDITNLGEEFSEIWMEKGPSSEYFTHGSSEDGKTDLSAMWVGPKWGSSKMWVKVKMGTQTPFFR